MTTISKTTALALAALLVGGSVAMPVLAADSRGFDSDFYVTRLHYAGINAIDADDYSGDVLRATVRLDNGSEVFQFFDKNTLQPTAPHL